MFQLRHVLFIFLVVLPIFCFGQTQHNPRYDLARKVHFGFSIGGFVPTLSYTLSPQFYTNDTIKTIRLKQLPGIAFGGIFNLHIGERGDFRIIPSLLLGPRQIDYSFTNGPTKTKQIESVYADLPFYFKYKSVRHNNTRFYILAGGDYSYDVAAKGDNEQDYFDPNVALIHNNFYWSYGFGFDLYFKFFKLSPEIRIQNSLNDVISHQSNVYSSSFAKLQSRLIMISFHFE